MASSWSGSALLIAGAVVRPARSDEDVALGSADEDAFLPTDLGVRHGLAASGADAARAGEIATAWRPYRGFAVAHLSSAATSR
jgi:hypothetical protein